LTQKGNSEDVMGKRVQLVLQKDISKLGRTGDLVEVAAGYARNYLLPQKFAIHVTPGILKQVERRREEERQRLLELKKEAQTIKAVIEGKTYTVSKQVGENEAIFGTVTTQDVADVVQAKTNKDIDRRTITLPEIKKLGTYKAEIKLHPEVTATIEVQVTAEN
jgi:large subunit ribosomal protein L9